MWGVSLTHSVLASVFLSRKFPSHIPCWFHFYVGSVSYTSRAGFVFIWGVSLTHPALASFLCSEFHLHIPCWLHFYLGSFSYTSHAGFFFSFFFFYVEFLLHIPCRFLFFFFFFFLFYLGSFSNTSRPAFFFFFFLCVCVGSFSGMQSSLKTTPKEKSWVEDGPEKKKVKKSHSKQRRNPTTPYTKQNKTKQELSDKWPQERKGNKRNGS